MNPMLSLFISGTLTTLWVAFVGLCIGMTLGCIAGIMSSRRITSPFIARAIQAYVFVMQGTPLYVQLLLMCFALPQILNAQISPLTAGIITIGMNSVAYVAQIVRGGINSIPAGQWEAAYVLGYSQRATLWYIILPQMVRTVLPSLINETISLVKETSIMGAVGIVELTKVAKDTVSRTLEPQWFLIAAGIYLAITGLLGIAAHALERKFDYDKGL
ncbi:MAG: arginine/lysine/histidine transport system permease protein [Candidatus Dependentiae bacterium]|nr:arginine/lysine/histidine transport system permease protein [Candidatus Dependentiae bacterium]